MSHDAPRRHPARVLIVEDNATTARTLRLFLDAQGYIVTVAANGADALASFSSSSSGAPAASAACDLILLDLMLPDVDGLTICRTVRQTSRVPIIMLTARSSEDDVVAGLEAGADDYVCKPFGSRALLARVRRCLERAREPEPAGARFRARDVELDVPARAVRVAGRAIRLTRSEFDLLHLLMRQPGRVFTRSQIIDHALGSGFDGFERTVDTHIWSLRRKIGDRRGDERLIVSEPGVGYRLRDVDDAS